MPIYDYSCSCGHRFESLMPTVDAPSPPCPVCGNEPRRRPAAVSLGGRADPGPGPEQAPKSWAETNGGDRETVLQWQRTLDRRRKLEEKYPELAGDRRPIAAHEGPYESQPLRVGQHPGRA